MFTWTQAALTCLSSVTRSLLKASASHPTHCSPTSISGCPRCVASRLHALSWVSHPVGLRTPLSVITTMSINLSTLPKGGPLPLRPAQQAARRLLVFERSKSCPLLPCRCPCSLILHSAGLCPYPTIQLREKESFFRAASSTATPSTGPEFSRVPWSLPQFEQY